MLINNFIYNFHFSFQKRESLLIMFLKQGPARGMKYLRTERSDFFESGFDKIGSDSKKC